MHKKTDKLHTLKVNSYKNRNKNTLAFKGS